MRTRVRRSTSGGWALTIWRSTSRRGRLDRWLARLDELGIPHSGITEEEPWDILVFRDPDNIQLGFFYLKADPTSFVPA